MNVLTVPGEGFSTFIKVVESEIIPVQQRSLAPTFTVTAARPVSMIGGEAIELNVVQSEADLVAEFRAFLRTVDATQDPPLVDAKPKKERKPLAMMWVVVGVVAWLIAAALLIYAFSDGGGGATLPVSAGPN